MMSNAFLEGTKIRNTKIQNCVFVVLTSSQIRAKVYIILGHASYLRYLESTMHISNRCHKFLSQRDTCIYKMATHFLGNEKHIGLKSINVAMRIP